MRTIELTRGKVALVDDGDFDWLSRFEWYAMQPNRSTIWYACRMDKRKAVLMHREIAEAKPGEEVDHKNHNGLDNRRNNLRRCTAAQNRQNTRKRTDCSSRYKGVSWSKHWSKWHGYININGKRRHLGWFDDETEAALAYNRAARELFGEFAHVNEVAA